MSVNLIDKMFMKIFYLLSVVLFLSYSTTFAALGPEPKNIHISDIRKTNVYIKEGLFLGGDQLMNQASVTGLRYSSHKKDERIVIDLSGTHKGELSAIARPPYYQVQVDPLLKRAVLTLYGNPISLQFNEKNFLSQLKKSSFFQSAEVFPLLEKDRWTVVFHLKKNSPVEVFELKNPTRIVIDFKKD